VEVKREPKEWRDIRVSQKAPNLTLLDQSLVGGKHKRRQRETTMVLLLMVYQPWYLLVPSLPPGTMNITEVRGGEMKYVVPFDHDIECCPSISPSTHQNCRHKQSRNPQPFQHESSLEGT
jgi:hypothetical protein